MQLLEKLNKLRELSGNAQLDYLKSVCDDMLREVLLYTYDPDKTYKIDEGKYERIQLHRGLIPRKKKQEFTVDDWIKFTQILDKLVEKRAVTDSEVKNVKFFITDFVDKDIQSFLCMVLFKDLRLNLGIAKLQTACGIFLDKPQVQLAENYVGVDFEYGVYSRKFDGKRMYIEDNVPYSRTNIVCYTNPVSHILEQVEELLDLDNTVNGNYFVLDGECLYFENGVENFQKGISLCQSEERKFGCDNICYVIFDMIPKENFHNRKQWHDFETEYDKMVEAFADFSKPSPSYSLIPTKMPSIFIARQDKDMTKLAKLCSENNWEGLMYRNVHAPYEFKRTKNLLKIKAMKDAEFELMGLQSGTGKNKNRLGKLLIKYKDNLVGVGSGFSDTDRDLLWANSKIFMSSRFSVAFDVKVQYFKETTDADGKPSLRFPVFLCFRHKDSKEEMTVQQVLEFCEERDNAD